MNQPYGYVYRIRNKITGETYVGQRMLSYDVSWRSYMGSGILVKKAIYDEGKDRFVKEFIVYAHSRKELDALETIFIKKEKKEGRGQYNIYLSSPGTSLSPIDKETLLELYINRGWSTRKIAIELGVSNPTIAKWLREYGVEIERNTQTSGRINRDRITRKNPDPEKIYKLYIEDQIPLKDIGIKYGVTKDVVKRWILEMGYPIRNRGRIPK